MYMSVCLMHNICLFNSTDFKFTKCLVFLSFILSFYPSFRGSALLPFSVETSQKRTGKRGGGGIFLKKRDCSL